MLFFLSFVFIAYYVFLVSFFVFVFFFGGFMYDYFWFWGDFEITISFIFDFLSMGFFSCVSFISGLVFLYSFFYMSGTVDMRRFWWLVFLFVVSMFFLVFSGNFFLTMVGWDGLGLVSFCLVIYYSNSVSLESGLITVFSNRIGDVFFLLSFFFFSLGGWLNFDVSSFYYLNIFCLFIFAGAMTKSAQIPFSAWLPAAMAAPTPVSSLVHSSTLVTAGVYVLIRFNYVFLSFGLSFFKVFFVFTMILAGFSAFMEKDFKKIVAMSTLSQLGMMMFILSVGLWLFSFIHMMIHALFKSMLFLSTGSLMGQVGGAQESRAYGSNFMNYSSFIYFFVSCLCLSGFPFVIGFYSKDFIINHVSLSNGVLYFYIFLLGCLFTVVYSIRLIVEAYFRMFKSYTFFSHQESNIFFAFIFLLFTKGWVLGGLFYWLFLVDCSFMLKFFDIFVGLLLLICGVLLFIFLQVFYDLVYFLSLISFLRWISSNFMSFVFKGKTVHSLENGWIETVGGGGVFSCVTRLSYTSTFFEKVSIGFLLLFLFFLSFYLF